MLSQIFDDDKSKYLQTLKMQFPNFSMINSSITLFFMEEKDNERKTINVDERKTLFNVIGCMQKN